MPRNWVLGKKNLSSFAKAEQKSKSGISDLESFKLTLRRIVLAQHGNSNANPHSFLLGVKGVETGKGAVCKSLGAKGWSCRLHTYIIYIDVCRHTHICMYYVYVLCICIWYMIYDMWYMINFYLIYDELCMIYDIWYLIFDIWYICKHLNTIKHISGYLCIYTSLPIFGPLLCIASMMFETFLLSVLTVQIDSLLFETYPCCFWLSRTLVLGPVGKGWDYVATPNSTSRENHHHRQHQKLRALVD